MPLYGFSIVSLLIQVGLIVHAVKTGRSWLWVAARLATEFIAEVFVRMLLDMVYVPVIVGWKLLDTFRTGTGTIGRRNAFGRGANSPGSNLPCMEDRTCHIAQS